jgi:hypothetical protein
MKSISVLKAKVSQLEGQNSDLQKMAKDSEKSLIPASNKEDELKKLCESLVKRITKRKARGPPMITLQRRLRQANHLHVRSHARKTNWFPPPSK